MILDKITAPAVLDCESQLPIYIRAEAFGQNGHLYWIF